MLHANPEDRGRAHSGDSRQRMLSGLSLTERRLQVAGVSTVLLEAGGGPPLVLLHGGIECGGSVWAPAVTHLAESHHVIIPDLPGLGESEPMDRLDAVAFSHWLAALLDLTCDERPDLIAHSLGGSLAARFAAQHGDLLQRLVLYGAPGIGPYRMPVGLRLVAIRFALRPSEANVERFDRWAFFDYDRARRQAPEWFEAFGAYTLFRAVVPHVKKAMGRLIKVGTKQVPDTELANIEIPTTLVWGRHDRFVPLGLAEEASTRLGWPLHVVDGAGHVPHIEQPDAFISAVHTALG